MAFDFGNHRQQSLDAFRISRPQYEQFAEAVRSVLRASIPASCPIHSIDARAKGLEQFADKACKRLDGTDRPKYEHPLEQIKDLAGIRVITYFPRNVDDVGRSIESEFDVTERTDKGEELLASNRFGYQSIHYLIKLRTTRTDLAEYRRFDGFTAEVQVRTILQHAWAEMEHDIQYKSIAAIPASIRRRFMSLAGMLEIADREFQTIQDTDAELRKEVRLPLDQELTASDELKVELAPPEQQIEILDADARPEARSYLSGSARALLMSGYYAEAVKAYDQVIENNPRVHTNYIGRARAHFLSGNVTAALGDLNEAQLLFPSDPQIARLRSQIEEGTATSPEERAIAQREAFEGNRLLAEGDAEGALMSYAGAEAAGWNFVFSQFNKATAACLEGDVTAMNEHLSTLRVRRDSAYGVTLAALRVLGALVAEQPHEALLEDLSSQRRAFPGYSFSRSHLRYLEEGLSKRSKEAAQRAAVAFEILRDPGGIPEQAQVGGA